MPVDKTLVARIKESARAASKSEDFYILIWGSGRARKVDYQKRCKIRDVLRGDFGSDKVFFSEDRDLKEFTQREGVIRAELEQLKHVHFVVVLASSIGPLLEVAIYYPVLRNKAFVLVPKEHKEESSFAFQVLSLVTPYWYSEKEFKTDRLEILCSEKAKAYRTAKMIHATS